MAEGKITITILGEGGGEKSSGGSSVAEKTPNNILKEALQKVMHPLGAAEDFAKDTINELWGSGAIAKLAVGTKAVLDVANTTYSLALMEHGRYFSLTENYIGQNKMNQFQTQMSAAKTLFTSVGGGAIAGSAFGPIGAAIGAVGGGVKTIITTAIERDKKIEQYNMQLNAINAQMEFMSSRASLINGGRGTEN